MESTSQFILNFSSDFDKKTAKIHVHKKLLFDRAFRENWCSDAYIYIYWCGGKSLAQPGTKQATVTKLMILQHTPTKLNTPLCPLP